VFVTDGSTSNTIGGLTPADRNIISGNGDGVALNGNGVTGNLVQGNYIGTDLTGTKAVGNDEGVLIAAPGDTIGGTTPAARNLISGNQRGIDVYGQYYSINGTLVEGNDIGTDVTGTLPLGNQDGIFFETVSTTSGAIQIGGAAAGAGNIIADNSHDGVYFSSQSAGNLIRSNAIYANGNLGIDLGDPFTPGDLGFLHRAPGLIAATANADGSVTVTGSVRVFAGSSITLEFFGNPTSPATGPGQGQILLGTAPATVGDDGLAPFSVTLAGADQSAVHYITATSTTADNTTSGFSLSTWVDRANTSVTITAPNDHRTVSSLPVIRGTATDDLGAGDIARVDLLLIRQSDGEFWVPGTGWSAARTTFAAALGTGGHWSTTGVALPAGADLVDGQYTIWAYATNQAGGRGQSAVTITINTAATDTTPPAPAIFTATVVASQLQVQGTAADNPGGSGVAGVQLLIVRASDGMYWTGSAATGWSATRTTFAASLDANGHWSAIDGTLPGGTDLPSGAYRVWAYVFDQAGNRSDSGLALTVADPGLASPSSHSDSSGRPRLPS
jgi:hypothetical protein